MAKRGRPRKYATPEESAEAKAIYCKNYQHKNQKKRLFISAKQRANKCGLEFSIKEDDIHIPEFCPLLGTKITNIYGSGRTYSNASIDRKDSSKGYTKDNIWIISDLANRMKQDATEEQLVAFATGVLKMYNKCIDKQD